MDDSRSMDRTYDVDSPDRLAALAQEWQDAQKQQQQPETKVKINLLLLQPLAAADVLAQCRNPLSRHFHDENGNILETVTNFEYLDLSALGKLWRKAWAQVPPQAVESVCFDLALPARRPDDGTRVVHWDSGIPSEGGLGVQTQESINLVVTLGTTLKVREGGAGVEYALKNDGDERMSPGPAASLGKILMRLSEYSRKSTAQQA